MTFVFCLAVTLAVILTCDKAIKKYPYIFYIGASILSIGAYCINNFVEVRNLAPFVREYLVPILTNAVFATAFWTVVMWAGALKNGSKLIKKIMPIRGELSITAALLTAGHVVIYGMSYLSRLFSGRGITGDFILFFIVAVVLVVIMTPLTVLSVKKIRKKMSGKTWKNIQRAAYIFYAMMYLHIVLALWTKIQRGNTIGSDNIAKYIDLVIYTAVFVGYGVCRIRKYYLLKKKSDKKITVNAVSSAGFAVCTLAVCLCAFPFSKLGKEEKMVYIPEVSAEVSEVSKTAEVIADEVSKDTETSTDKGKSETSVESKTSTVEKSEVSQTSKSEESKTESSLSSQTSEVSKTEQSDIQNSEVSVTQTSQTITENSVQQTSTDNNNPTVRTSQDTVVQQSSVNTETSIQQSSVPTQTSRQESSQQPTTVSQAPIQQSSVPVQPSRQESSQQPTTVSQAPVQQSSVPVQEPSKTEEPSVVEEVSKNMLYNDGTYTGQSYGYDGDIYVTVVLSGDKIVSVTARSEESDEWYFETAERAVISAIINNQNTDVDTVSGATYSSNGIKSAVQQALNSAKI